jgi:hypothetical protein
LAGIFQDDPQWDESQTAIATYRQEEDAKLEAEYEQMDQAVQRLDQGNLAA